MAMTCTWDRVVPGCRPMVGIPITDTLPGLAQRCPMPSWLRGGVPHEASPQCADEPVQGRNHAACKSVAMAGSYPPYPPCRERVSVLPTAACPMRGPAWQTGLGDNGCSQVPNPLTRSLRAPAHRRALRSQSGRPQRTPAHAADRREFVLWRQLHTCLARYSISPYIITILAQST